MLMGCGVPVGQPRTASAMFCGCCVRQEGCAVREAAKRQPADAHFLFGEGLGPLRRGGEKQRTPEFFTLKEALLIFYPKHRIHFNAVSSVTSTLVPRSKDAYVLRVLQ